MKRFCKGLAESDSAFRSVFTDGASEQAVSDLCLASTKALGYLSALSRNELIDLESKLDSRLISYAQDEGIWEEAVPSVFEQPAPPESLSQARRPPSQRRSLRRRFQAKRPQLDGEVWRFDDETFALFTSAMSPAARMAALVCEATKVAGANHVVVALVKAIYDVEISESQVPLVFLIFLLLFFLKMYIRNNSSHLSPAMICIYCVSDDFCSEKVDNYTTIEEVSGYYAKLDEGKCSDELQQQISLCNKRHEDARCGLHKLSQELDGKERPRHATAVEQVLTRLRDTHHLFLLQDEMDPTEFDLEGRFVRNERVWLT